MKPAVATLALTALLAAALPAPTAAYQFDQALCADGWGPQSDVNTFMMAKTPPIVEESAHPFDWWAWKLEVTIAGVMTSAVAYSPTAYWSIAMSCETNELITGQGTFVDHGATVLNCDYLRRYSDWSNPEYLVDGTWNGLEVQDGRCYVGVFWPAEDEQDAITPSWCQVEGWVAWDVPHGLLPAVLQAEDWQWEGQAPVVGFAPDVYSRIVGSGIWRDPVCDKLSV